MAYSSYGDVWQDTILWIHSFFPSWVTGTVAVDVPIGREGIQQLAEILPTLQGKTLLISPRTQFVLWQAMREEMGLLDDSWTLSLEMPSPYAEQLQANLTARYRDLETRSQALFNMNNDSLRKGMEPALEDEWKLLDYGIEQTAGPGGAALSISSLAGPLIIAAAVIVGAYFLTKIVAGFQEASILKYGIEELRRTGHPEEIAKILTKVPGGLSGSKFPWGWVAGGTIVVVGGALFFKWIWGEIGK